MQFGKQAYSCVGCGRSSMTAVGARTHEDRCGLAEDFLAAADDGAGFALLESFIRQLRETAQELVASGKVPEGQAASIAAAADAAWETLWDAESRRYQQELRELAAARQGV
ncbi:hypothetical protein [Actinomadura sp. 3N407]|uniref:hypothetical protein n=1 Tax=Actinomadura sp. 3N407 TaxID=3457423 RepID=UPI003FCEABCB